MSRTNRSDAPLFQVRNHHSAASGPPPHIDDLRPNQYLGYFENQYGEQAVFVYDGDSSQALLYLGDAGWETSHTVVDGVWCPIWCSPRSSGCGYVRAGKPPPANPRRCSVIDNPA